MADRPPSSTTITTFGPVVGDRNPQLLSPPHLLQFPSSAGMPAPPRLTSSSHFPFRVGAPTTPLCRRARISAPSPPTGTEIGTAVCMRVVGSNPDVSSSMLPPFTIRSRATRPVTSSDHPPRRPQPPSPTTLIRPTATQWCLPSSVGRPLSAVPTSRRARRRRMLHRCAICFPSRIRVPRRPTSLTSPSPPSDHHTHPAHRNRPSPCPPLPSRHRTITVSIPAPSFPDHPREASQPLTSHRRMVKYTTNTAHMHDHVHPPPASPLWTPPSSPSSRTSTTISTVAGRPTIATLSRYTASEPHHPPPHARLRRRISSPSRLAVMPPRLTTAKTIHRPHTPAELSALRPLNYCVCYVEELGVCWWTFVMVWMPI